MAKRLGLSNDSAQRLLMAAVAGFLAWWLTSAAVPAPFALLPCAALATALASRRPGLTWLLWGLGIAGLTVFLLTTVRSPHTETVLAAVALTLVFAGLTAGTSALVTSRGFPRYSASLIVWFAIISTVTGEVQGWTVPIALAVLAGAAAVASWQKSLQRHNLRPLILLLAILMFMVVAAGILPVGRSPAQGPLAEAVQHAFSPNAPMPAPSGQETPEATPQTGPAPLIRYAAPLFSLWVDTLTRVLTPLAIPLILGLMTLLAGLLMLLLITRNPLSHVLRMLTLPLLLLGAVVVAVLIASSLQLPHGPALMKLYQQLAAVSGLAKAQQPAAVGQALHEVTRSVPSWLQVFGAVTASAATLAIVISVALILSKAIFDTRFGFLLNVPDPRERKRIAASIRRVASLDEASLAANPREAVIALFYMGVAALKDMAITLARGETPEELVLRTRQRSEAVSSCLESLASGFYVARYSKQDVDLGQATYARNAYSELLSAVRAETGAKRANRQQPITF